MSDAISERPWEFKPPCGWCEGPGALLAGNDFPWLRPKNISLPPSCNVRSDWKRIERVVRETWTEALCMGLNPVEVQLGPQEWSTLAEGVRVYFEAILTRPFENVGTGFEFCGKRIVQSSVPGVIVVVGYTNESGGKLAVKAKEGM